MVVLTADPVRVKYLFDHINDDISGSFLAAVISTTALATIAVALRYISRFVTKAPFGWDDHTIVLALITAWGMLASNIFQVKHGAGHHLVAVDAVNFAEYVKGTWALELTYFTTIFITKISILLLYRRIFSLQNRGFRIAFWGIMTYSAVVWCISFFASMFQCVPVNYNWDRTIPGHCLNFYLFTIVSSVMNILADVLILVMPLPAIWHMNVNRNNKIALSGVFLLGSFVCVASIVRFPFLLNIPIDDLTYSNDGAARWSTVEANIAIVSACLPSLRPLWGQLKSRVSSSAGRSAQTGSNGLPWYSDQNGIGGSTSGGSAPRSGPASKKSLRGHHKNAEGWDEVDKSDIAINTTETANGKDLEANAWEMQPKANGHSLKSEAYSEKPTSNV